MANFHITRRDRNPNTNTPATLWRTWDSFATDFDSFFEDIENSLGLRQGREAVRNQSDRKAPIVPPAEVHENDRGYELSFDMPGFKSDEIQIDLSGKTLTVMGQRERITRDGQLHQSEKFYGEYRRSITVPETIKADQIEASYEYGVLSIHLPKAQVEQPRKIAIGLKKNPQSLNQSANAPQSQNSKLPNAEQPNVAH